MQEDGQLLSRLLDVIEHDIVPLTREGVRVGNKLFGAAVLLKSDRSLVIAGTNTEIECPLWHGEVATIKRLYELPAEERPDPASCIFLSTHEPCSLCLSAITWAGFDNFYYLFSYEDSRDSFNIPHDLLILQEVFDCPAGSYVRENHFWKSNGILEMIDRCKEPSRSDFQDRVERLEGVYEELSTTYQRSKGSGRIPLD